MGTATWAWNNQRDAVEFYGHNAVAIGKITFSDDYATDGDALDWAAVTGLREVLAIFLKATDGATYLFVADLANDKILAYTAIGTQAANEANLSAVVIENVMVIGNI